MYLVRAFDAFHILLVAGSAVVLVAAVLLAAAGVSMAVCLLVVMLAPIVVVVGYEIVGHRHAEDAIDGRCPTNCDRQRAPLPGSPRVVLRKRLDPSVVRGRNTPGRWSQRGDE